MKQSKIKRMLLAAFLLLLARGQASAQTDALPSWNDGGAKKTIVEFVKATTEKGSAKFVAPEARIAVFDQARYSQIRCFCRDGARPLGRAPARQYSLPHHGDAHCAGIPRLKPSFFSCSRMCWNFS